MVYYTNRVKFSQQGILNVATQAEKDYVANVIGGKSLTEIARERGVSIAVVCANVKRHMNQAQLPQLEGIAAFTADKLLATGDPKWAGHAIRALVEIRKLNADEGNDIKWVEMDNDTCPL